MLVPQMRLVGGSLARLWNFKLQMPHHENSSVQGSLAKILPVLGNDTDADTEGDDQQVGSSDARERIGLEALCLKTICGLRTESERSLVGE